MYDNEYQLGTRTREGMDPTMKLLLIIVGVAVGVYLGNVLYTQYMLYQVEQSAIAFTKGLQEQTAQVQQNMAQVERERTRQKQLELEFKSEQIARQAANQQAAQEAARSKEAAWKKFYKQPERCEDLSKPAVMVECANYFMKQKQRFEAMWAAGQN